MIYKSQDGVSPLTIASKSGHTKIVRTLTGTDTDVNYLTEVSYIPIFTVSADCFNSIPLHIKKILPQDGLTALGYASLNGHVSIVDALITAKADVNLCAGKVSIQWLLV